MKTYELRREQTVGRPLEEVFDFFADPANLERLTPDWLSFRMLTPAPLTMRTGLHIEYVIRWHGLPLRWLTEIEEWCPGVGFVDRQLRGPYRLWRHTHTFVRAGAATRIEDVVHYALPAGTLGRLAHALVVRRDLARIFDYRARQVRALFSPDRDVSTAGRPAAARAAQRA